MEEKKRKRYTKAERLKRAKRKRLILIISMALCLFLIIFGVVKTVSFIANKVTDTQEAVSAEAEELSIEMETEEVVPEPITITMSFTGDCTLGTDFDYGAGGTFVELAEEVDTSYFFENVKDIFAADDLTIVNLEGPLTDSEDKQEKTFAFKGDPSYIDILVDGFVDVVCVANNHSYDYGVEGYEDTLAVTTEAGVVPYGYENTQIVDVNGVSVGFVGMYELSEGIGIKDEMIELIEGVKANGADVVVVSFHWGIETEHYPTDTQTELAYAAIDNGADLVVGHHPHVLQGIEEYNGKYIAYSLANFCFGGNRNPNDKDTIIFQQSFTVDVDGEIIDSDLNIIPCCVSSDSSYNNFQPTPLEGDELTRVAEKLEEFSMTDISSFISYEYQ